MIAGTAPPARTAATLRSSASALAGAGRPNGEKIVDSSATTARAVGERVPHFRADDDGHDDCPRHRHAAGAEPAEHTRRGRVTGLGRGDRIGAARGREQEPARERVTRAGRVDDRAHRRRGNQLVHRAPEQRGPGAALHDDEARTGEPVLVEAERVRFVGVAEHDVGFDLAHEPREARRRRAPRWKGPSTRSCRARASASRDRAAPLPYAAAIA